MSFSNRDLQLQIFTALIMLVLLFASAFILSIGCGAAGSGEVTTTTNSDLLYTVYPDTEEAPVLTLYWGVNKEGLNTAEVAGVGQFGVWEGSGTSDFKAGCEPASEMEMYLYSNGWPIYSYTCGTIVYLGSDEIGIRYGRNYVIKHEYVGNMSALSLGQTVEAGTLLGYTKDNFWEIELDKWTGPLVARAIPAYGYFDAPSQVTLMAICQASGKSGWVISSASTLESWIPYAGTAEMWADTQKMGIALAGTQSLEGFLAEYNLLWTLK